MPFPVVKAGLVVEQILEYQPSGWGMDNKGREIISRTYYDWPEEKFDETMQDLIETNKEITKGNGLVETYDFVDVIIYGRNVRVFAGMTVKENGRYQVLSEPRIAKNPEIVRKVQQTIVIAK